MGLNSHMILKYIEIKKGCQLLKNPMELRRRDRYCPNRPRVLFLKLIRKSFEEHMYASRLLLSVLCKKVQEEIDRYLRLFLLPSCVCDTPDKGKKLRYPHMLVKNLIIIPPYSDNCQPYILYPHCV